MPRETCRFTCSALLALSLSAAPEISFDEPRVFSVNAPARLRSILSGDWNADGKTDLASVSERSVWIFEGDGDGGFRPVLELPLGGSPAQVTAVDLNSDGRTDLLVQGCTDEGLGCTPGTEMSAFMSDGDFRFRSP